MGTSLALLDEALRIGGQELDALRAEDVELAEKLYAERVALTSQVWGHESSTSVDVFALVARSRALLVQQEQLAQEARALKMNLQKELNLSRCQTKRIKGYGLAIKQALSA